MLTMPVTTHYKEFKVSDMCLSLIGRKGTFALLGCHCQISSTNKELDYRLFEMLGLRFDQGY